jgi:hypothetical protein
MPFEMKRYPAPWSLLLVVVSSLVTVLCVSISCVVLFRAGRLTWAAWLPLILLGAAGLFTVRGYTLKDGTLWVHRLLWDTRLPLDGLQTARYEVNAMRSSLRTFGNGGLFSFSGCYWSKSLGSYRAWVTDQKQTVILQFDRRKVVISPESPEEFVKDVLQHRSPVPPIRPSRQG